MAASELPEKLWFLIFIHCSKVSAVTDELLGKNTRCLQLFAGRHFKEICLTSAVIWVFHSPNTENFMHTSFFMEEFIEFQLCILTGQMHKGNMVCVTLIFSQKQYFPSVKSMSLWLQATLVACLLFTAEMPWSKECSGKTNKQKTRLLATPF